MIEKNLSNISVAIFIAMSATAFAYVQYTSAILEGFPYFHLGCIIVGGVMLISLKNKYSRIYLTEAIGAFALFTITVSLSTPPVMEMIAWLID